MAVVQDRLKDSLQNNKHLNTMQIKNNQQTNTKKTKQAIAT